MKIEITFIMISKLFEIEFENLKKIFVDEKENVTFVNERFSKRRRNCIVII